MNLKQLKAKGGIVDGVRQKKELIWKHPDPKTGDEVTETFTIHVLRQSFGAIERTFATAEPAEVSKSRNAQYIAACVSLGPEGEEMLSYDDAFGLESSLGILFLTAVNEVNGTGKVQTKN